jgi:hypothetical protein
MKLGVARGAAIVGLMLVSAVRKSTRNQLSLMKTCRSAGLPAGAWFAPDRRPAFAPLLADSLREE